MLRPELAAVIGADRFLSEIKTTANLQHPHILPLFDSGAAASVAESPSRGAASFCSTSCRSSRARRLRDRLDREKQLPID